MKEIKFRQPITCSNCKTNGFQFWEYNGQQFIENGYTPCKCGKNAYEIFKPIEQFTGLLDKDGKDLDWWEGDLCDLFGDGRAYEIVQEKCMWVFINRETGFHIPLHIAAKWDGVKKIGSIHANPELMEDGQ